MNNVRPRALRRRTNACLHESPCLVNGQLTKKTGVFGGLVRVCACKYGAKSSAKRRLARSPTPRPKQRQTAITVRVANEAQDETLECHGERTRRRRERGDQGFGQIHARLREVGERWLVVALLPPAP